jgi:hypothetical protein
MVVVTVARGNFVLRSSRDKDRAGGEEEEEEVEEEVAVEEAAAEEMGDAHVCECCVG